MKRSIFILLVLLSFVQACKEKSDLNINLKYEQNLSLEYDEVIDAYKKLADYYPEARLVEMGETDIGKPLHLFMISADKDFNPVSLKKKGKCIIMVNNGIHPGEPEGIDASIQFAWDILSNRNDLSKYLDKVVIGIIPVYNIGGSLDQSEYYRTNQNGPVYKGRRRNARNLDLNRDFAKQESKNARSFVRTFLFLNPDIFIDTHTTNGSDHQYTLTLIPTLYSKLDTSMGDFFKNKMIPDLYKRMEENSEYGMIPYVQMKNYTGDIKDGIMGFNDDAYYSTGYTSLFNCYSFMTENLVYKYFPDRVKSVIDFLTQVTDFAFDNCAEIRNLKDEADIKVRQQKTFHLDWQVDMSYSEDLLFKGYEFIRTEPVEGRWSRGYYDHEQPWTDTIPYYTKFDPVLTVEKPWAYIIPQAWSDIIEKLHYNEISIYRLDRDTELEVESYYIDNAERSERATQGHYLNRNIKVRKVIQKMQYYKGDYLVITNQHANKYIVEMLEPQAPNSYLAWNYFDPVLESSDFYSIWGFESHLMDMLKENDDLRSEMEKKKSEDQRFANDPLAQLRFLYEKAPMYEIEKYNRLYPVARLWSDPGNLKLISAEKRPAFEID